MHGIVVNKHELDKENSISKNRVPSVIPAELRDRLDKVTGPKFSFREIFKDELEGESDISSIKLDKDPTPDEPPSLFLEVE